MTPADWPANETPDEARVHGLRAGAVACRSAASHLRKAGAEALAQQATALADEAARLLRGDEPTREIAVTLPAPPPEKEPGA